MVGPALVGAPEAPDGFALEVALALKNLGIQELLRPGAQGPAQPGPDRHGETGLRPFNQRRRHMAIQQLTQGPLAGTGATAGADLHGQGQTPGHGGHAVIKEGGAGFQAGGHCCAVYLHEDVGGEVGADIGEHQLLRAGRSRGQGSLQSIRRQAIGGSGRQPVGLQEGGGIGPEAGEGCVQLPEGAAGADGGGELAALVARQTT